MERQPSQDRAIRNASVVNQLRSAIYATIPSNRVRQSGYSSEAPGPFRVWAFLAVLCLAVFGVN